MIDVFPADQQNKIRATLSESLKGVVAQNLFKRVDRKGRVAALEILIFQYRRRQPGARRQNPSNSRHDSSRQKVRQHSARRLHHGPISNEAYFFDEALRQVHRQKEFRAFLAHPPEEDDHSGRPGGAICARMKRPRSTSRNWALISDSYVNGLRAALRQAPKVILVGEMRDRDTVKIALRDRRNRAPGLEHAAYDQRRRGHQPYSRHG